MRRFSMLVSALVLVMAVLLVPASGLAKDYFLTPKVGTQGFGADLGYKFHPKLGVRANVNYFSHSREDTVDDIKYDAELDLFTTGVLLDYHPFGGSFRLTGGAYYNGNGLDMDGNLKDGATQDIGGDTYTSEELGTLEGDMDFNTLSPYVGMGWGVSSSDGSWFFSFDLGAMYQGSPDVSLSAENENEDFNNKNLREDLNKEEDDIEDDVDFEIYPVVAVGVTYRF